MVILWKYPYSSVNVYSYFVGANPITSFNPTMKYPRISKEVTLSPFCSIIGDVLVDRNVYIGPHVSIRADEGTPFRIGKHSNLQDGVILHGIKNERVEINKKLYSIYIDEEVSCAHGALIHGPCYIGKKVFVGFKAIIYHAKISEGAYISAGAVVTNGVVIPKSSFVPPGATIDTQEKADSLAKVPLDKQTFANEVQRVNQEFPAAYSMFFGNRRCSCGMTYSD